MKSYFIPNIFHRDGLPTSSIYLQEDYMTLDGDKKKSVSWTHSSQTLLSVCALIFDEQFWHGARPERKWLTCTFRNTGVKGNMIPKEIFEAES